MSKKSEQTRRRILDSALSLLEGGRLADVRMSDIAKDAGITRQALYLYFPTRAELLIATTLYVDELNDIDSRLLPSRTATTGVERLSRYIEAWGNYIPLIYGISRALMAVYDSDEGASKAWDGRMAAVKDGCQAAVKALKADGTLSADFTQKEAVDILMGLLSVENWARLTIQSAMSQKHYIKLMTRIALKLLVEK